MLVMHCEEQLLQPDLVPPGFEDTLAGLANVPGLGVLVQKSPALQYIDLVEPMLHNESETEGVHFLMNV